MRGGLQPIPTIHEQLPTQPNEVAAAAQRMRPNLKVLFMSGYLPSSFEPETRARIEPLLSKPFSARLLEQLVRAALGIQ